MAKKKLSEQQQELHGIAANLLTVPVLLEPAEWAIENRVYGPSTGHPGPRDPYKSPSLVPLSRAAVSGLYKRVVAVTAAQMAKTESLMDIIGQRFDQRPVPMIYVGPSVEFNRDQLEPRVMAMIDESESLGPKLLRGRDMKKVRKLISGVPLRLASAGSSTALKSDPAAMAFIDEYDEMTANIKGQGDPLGLVEVRGDTFADFVTVVTSTPSQGTVETFICEVSGLEFFALSAGDDVTSPIWRAFEQGTRHHWAWPCPECDEYFIPMRKHLHWPKDATAAEASRKAYMGCPHCGSIITEGKDSATKIDMNSRGIMIAPGQSIKEAIEGDNQPDNSTYSQWSSGLCSPFVTWGIRASRLITAQESEDEDKIQTAINANFGEVYSPGEGGDLPTWKALLEHKLPYKPNQVPRAAIKLVMAVDVQTNGLYYVTRGYGALGTSWLINNGFLHGRTDEDDVWNDLTQIWESPISGMLIERVFIDSGFRPNKKERGSEHRVYQYCHENSHVCWPTKGKSTYGGTPYSVSKIEVKPDGTKLNYSIKLVMINTDYFKSLVHSRIKRTVGKAGAFHLHNAATEEYARQVLSEVRLITPGKPNPVWKQQRGDNHYFDCEAMAAAAGFALNVHQIPEGVYRTWGEGSDIDNMDAEAPASDPDNQEATADGPPDDSKPKEPAPAPKIPLKLDLSKRFKGGRKF